jgi:hypothetical protein
MKKTQVIIAILIALSLSGCRTLVSDDFPDFENLPTVNSILVEGEPLSVLVSMTGKIDSLPLSAVNNAIVNLYIDGDFGEQLENTGSGTYTSKTIVEAGKEYRCKVAIPNRDTILCRQTLPVASPILKIEHINIAGRNEEGTTYPAIKLTFRNNKEEQNYCEVVIKYFLPFDDQPGQHIVWLQTIIDPIILNEGLPIALFSNELIKDSTYTMTLNYSNGCAGSSGGGPFRTTLFPLVVELRSVTYDYYRYKKQYYLYQKGITADGLLSPVTASPLYSNIESGYGIFAGYSVFATDTITPEPYEN